MQNGLPLRRAQRHSFVDNLHLQRKAAPRTQRPLTIIKRRVISVGTGLDWPPGNLTVSFAKATFAMPGTLKKRYFISSQGAYQALREYCPKPLSTLLLCFFLATHALAAYSELQGAKWPERSAQTDELTNSGPADQTSEATNWRKLRGEREVAASPVPKKIEARSHYRQVAAAVPPSTTSRHFFNSSSILCSVLCCEAPFSSRPPPTPSSLQG